MLNVRPEILRRFYASLLGGPTDLEVVYAGATFEEYYQLERILYARINRHTAAKNSPLERFRALAQTFPNEAAPPVEPVLRTVHLNRKPSLDLIEAPIDPDTEQIVLDRIKEISGWAVLTRWKQLRSLAVILCGSSDPAAPSGRAEIETVEVKECTPACANAVLRATSAEVLAVHTPDIKSFDLAVLDGHPKLRDLSTGAPILRNIERLKGRPLTNLGLGMPTIDDRLRNVLGSLTATLERLSLSTECGLRPEMIPDLGIFKKLTSVTLAIDPAHWEAWVDYAVAHPTLPFFFYLATPSQEGISAAIEEIYRGLDILRIAKGKKVLYEISGDLAADFDADNNEELEDRVVEIAKRAKKKITWSSEADTFVAQARDAETCRWLIDALHGNETGPRAETPPQKAPARAGAGALAGKGKGPARKRALKAK